MKLPLFALAMMVPFASSTFAADIAGVLAGASLSDAKAAIIKANAKFEISSLKSKTGMYSGIVATTPDRIPGTNDTDVGGPADQFVALQNGNGVVWFIARIQSQPIGSRINLATMTGSLKEQYGTPSSVESYLTQSITWQFERNRKQYIGPSNRGPCFDMGVLDRTVPGTSVVAPITYYPTELDAEGNTVRVPHADFTTGTVDMKSYLAWLNSHG